MKSTKTRILIVISILLSAILPQSLLSATNSDDNLLEMLLPVIIAAGQQQAEPALYPNYLGTQSNSNWDNINNWQPNGIPTIVDEVWMNSPDTLAIISPDVTAQAAKLIIGRRVPDVKVIIDGGKLEIGSDTTKENILFLGQYEGSSGELEIHSGELKVTGEFAVAINGTGHYIQQGGVAAVGGRLILGRYNNPSAKGYAVLRGGTLTADQLDINDYSYLEISGGQLYLQGDQTNKLNTLLAAGKIISSGTLSISYNAASNLTLLTSNVTSSNWDVAGILNLPTDKIGPRQPQIIRKTGMRSFKPAPAYGVHPRIFFGPEDIPTIRSNLYNTTVGQAALQQIKLITTLSREGRATYNALPVEQRNYPNGSSRLTNIGLFDRHQVYTALIAGDLNALDSENATARLVLSGFMSLEALECLIDDATESNCPERTRNLSKAMKTWAEIVLADSGFDPLVNETSRDLFGSQSIVFAYDLNYNNMNTSERETVRKAIAKMIWPQEKFVGIDTEGYATTTNWVAINSFVPMMILAIEGETDKTRDGWSTSELRSYFRDIMLANYKFLTYGWYESGAPYEGSGKNYQYNSMFSAYAKRGYNFFTHPHVQAYTSQFLPAQLQPFGRTITQYDTIGGTGFDPVTGDKQYHAVDIIGAKWAYPNDPAVNFAWRNFLETPYIDNDGQQQTFVDVNDAKVTPRSTYANNLFSLALMPMDFTAGDWETQNQQALDGLTFNGKERGLIITRSGYDKNALAMHFHARQDTGGHTFGDRNSFNLSALGRVWVRNPTGYIPETEWSSGILINGEGVTITNQDGRKARQPGRIAHYQDNPLATFVTGDATYAYSNEWAWSIRDPANTTVKAGWSAVTESWNDFRHPDNQLSEAYGDIPFFDYANWRAGGKMEGMIKRPANVMNQAYRLAGVVRGTYPYVMIVDDVRKAAGETHNYQWLAQIPEDLTLMPPADYSGNLNVATDIVLQEPEVTGQRRLLVRILNAEGTQANGLAQLREDITYYLWGLDRIAKRLVIERNTEAPDYRVLLYPYTEGDPIPKHIVQANGHIVAEWPGQRDTLVFEPYTKAVGGQSVGITGFRIFRSGETLVDTRGLVIPMEKR